MIWTSTCLDILDDKQLQSAVEEERFGVDSLYQIPDALWERIEPTPKSPQNMCLDKGYDFPEIDELVEQWGYTGHIARRGIDQSKRKRIPEYRARRWEVERTHSWLNRFRRLLIRWEEKKENYVA